MYRFYLDGVLLPVTPEKLEMKIKNQNKTANLINDGEINILKTAGLTEISFDIALPQTKYPYAIYEGEFKGATYYLEKIEKLKTELKPFQFIVTRKKPSGDLLFDTNMKVSLEDYSIKEDVKEGFDLVVSIKLKQYRNFGTKTIKIETKEENKTVAKETQQRDSASAPKTQTYKVKKGDCLWNIAKKFYGNGSQWKKIYNANKNKIKNPNLIYPNQVFIIP